MQEASHDVVIVGGGAAGLTAALYSCRAGLNTVMLERMMTGGQVLNAERIENFPGSPTASPTPSLDRSSRSRQADTGWRSGSWRSRDCAGKTHTG